MSTILKANVKNSRAHKSLLLALCTFALALPQAGLAEDKHESVSVSVKTLEKKAPSAQDKKQPSSKKLLFYRSSLDEQLIANIDETIAYLSKLATEAPAGSNQRLKFLVKILNLNFEQAIYVSIQESYRYDKEWQEWSNSGRKDTEPQLSETASKGHWKSVADQARRILSEFKTNPVADRIIYNEAIAEQYLGQKDVAAAALQKLVHDYPKSHIVYDAYFALGDYFFDKSDFHQALAYFTKSLNNANLALYGWSLFKVAWCHYNLGEFKVAISYWEKTIDFAETKMEDTKRATILKESAFRDLIWGFLEVQDTAGAVAYYRKHKGDAFVPTFLKRLADNYATKGYPKEALAAWEALLREVPLSKEAFEAQTEVVAASFEMKRYDLLWTGLERLHEQFKSDSAWAKVNHRDDVDTAKKKIPVLVSYYPKMLHKEAQKFDRAELYEQAVVGYTLYLKLYPQSEDHAEIMEYLGDILYYQKKYEKAGLTYAALVKMGPQGAVVKDDKNVKVNIHERSGKNMLDAFSKDFLPEFQVLLKATPDFTKPGKPLSSKAKNFMTACTLYVKWYPNDKATDKTCDIQLSEIYFRSAQVDHAKLYLYILVSKYPGQKEGIAAAENLIVIVKGKQKELIETATRILAIPVYAKSPIGDKLRELLRGVELEAITKEPSKIKRAQMYLDKVKRDPNDPEADKFLYNAGNDFLSLGEVSRARNAFADLVNNYPKSAVYAITLLTLGKLFDKTLESKRASQYFALYGQRYPKDKDGPAAQLRSCELMILQDYVGAWSLCQSYVMGDPHNGIPIVDKLITIAWYKKNYPWMISLITQTYLSLPTSVDQKIVALYKIAQVGSPEQKSQAVQQIQSLGKQKGVSGEALRYVAELAFVAGERQYSQQMTLVLQGGTVDKLQASIQHISEGLAALENAYGPTLQTQDAFWGVAVFYRLASAYETFGQMLMAPPVVEGVADADLKAHLQGSVDQVMGKAKEYFDTGLGVAKKFNVYNSWAPLLMQADRRLKNKQLIRPAWVVQTDIVGGFATTQLTQLME